MFGVGVGCVAGKLGREGRGRVFGSGVDGWGRVGLGSVWVGCWYGCGV